MIILSVVACQTTVFDYFSSVLGTVTPIIFPDYSKGFVDWISFASGFSVVFSPSLVQLLVCGCFPPMRCRFSVVYGFLVVLRYYNIFRITLAHFTIDVIPQYSYLRISISINLSCTALNPPGCSRAHKILYLPMIIYYIQ